MANQQKRVQQETAYNYGAAVVNDHVPTSLLTQRICRNDVGGDWDTYDYSLQLHPIGSFLLHSICHPYTPSFHEITYI